MSASKRKGTAAERAVTDDIVTRLREGLWRNDCCSSPSCNGDWYTPLDDKDFIEAADEIERLRAEVARLGSFVHPIGTVINGQAVRGE